MIKPTIGRVVWFWPLGDQTTEDPNAQPLAALVTYVWKDNCVNLMVANRDGMPMSCTSVFLWQGEGSRPVIPFAEWMPYQISQARKYADNSGGM